MGRPGRSPPTARSSKPILAAGPPMLEVSDLHAGYGPLRILRGIDMRIEEREIVAVLGANGVGKTTLNNTLSGLIRPAQGSIRFLEESIGGRAAERIVASGLVQVPQRPRVFSQPPVWGRTWSWGATAARNATAGATWSR